MKKFILSTLSLLMAVTMSAINYQSQVTITLDDGIYMHSLVIGASSDLAEGVITNGYAAEIQNIDEMPVAVFALYKGVSYSTLAMHSLDNMRIGFKSSSATSYTLYFDDVVGTVKLFDKKLQAAVPVSEGGEYAFTIDAEDCGKELCNRFVLFYEPGQAVNCVVKYWGKDKDLMDKEDIALFYFPEAPEIEGFTFQGWDVVAGHLEDGIVLQAVYTSDDPTNAPEVVVNPSNPSQKLVRNGQVYILRDKATYTLQGQMVK